MAQKLQTLWNQHQDEVLPKIIDFEGMSTEDIRDDLDAYDSHVAGLVLSVLDGETDHIIVTKSHSDSSLNNTQTALDWLGVDNNELDARIAAVIAAVRDYEELNAVALEYKNEQKYRVQQFKSHVDAMFNLVRSMLSHKM